MLEFGPSRAISDRILASFGQILSLPPERTCDIGVSIPIPTFSGAEIIEIVTRTREVLRQQETLLEVPVPVYIVGDLHGNLIDLIRILLFSGPPPANRFLFLGDYVDRGQFSVEIIALLFALVCKYPGHVFLLRGNHEFVRMNSIYGFKGELLGLYGAAGDELYGRINYCFNYLPLAAIVGTDTFCVHGGITPQVTTLRQIRQLTRPIETYDTSMIGDLMWSDPGFDTKDYVRNDRGNGVIFGVSAVRDFLRALGISKVIRAHQVVDSGVERFADDTCYTVFSCSNYQDQYDNRCGLIHITAKEELQAFSLPKIRRLPRQTTLFCGPLMESDSRGQSQNTLRASLMSMTRSESTDFAKTRVSRKPTPAAAAARGYRSPPGVGEPGLPRL
jgi:protein phosphatase